MYIRVRVIMLADEAQYVVDDVSGFGRCEVAVLNDAR